MKLVAVVDKQQKPLMPCSPKRARKLIEKKQATPFWKKGIFCIRLNKEPRSRNLQAIAVGIDPGSKREGFTVKSEYHTYLNIQTQAVDWVKDAIKVRRTMRRGRRFRKTPCRKNKYNRSINLKKLSPSTKARWQWKLRICNWLTKIFPISCFIVEDVKAMTKKFQKQWNKSFSPLQVGKNWFYSELRKLAKVELKAGYETKELRDLHGLKKTTQKLADKFSAHCVDSWVLANGYIGGPVKPDNEDMLIIEPIRLHRRQLHALQPNPGGIRRFYGGTISLGLKRGGLAKHKKHGISYIGGTSKGRVSLHNIETGKRLCQNAKVEDIKQLTFNYWRSRFLPALKDKVSTRGIR